MRYMQFTDFSFFISAASGKKVNSDLWAESYDLESLMSSRTILKYVKGTSNFMASTLCIFDSVLLFFTELEKINYTEC